VAVKRSRATLNFELCILASHRLQPQGSSLGAQVLGFRVQYLLGMGFRAPPGPLGAGFSVQCIYGLSIGIEVWGSRSKVPLGLEVANEPNIGEYFAILYEPVERINTKSFL